MALPTTRLGLGSRVGGVGCLATLGMVRQLICTIYRDLGGQLGGWVQLVRSGHIEIECGFSGFGSVGIFGPRRGDIYMKGLIPVI